MLNEEEERNKKKSLLKSYYNESTPPTAAAKNPLDINNASFDCDLYLSQHIKEKKLNELMDLENDVVKEIRSLDSEMQTLVYENYNKFISATDTIRKMKNDFKKMEDEMSKLVNNMDTITEFSDRINATFKDRRQEIGKLSGINLILKKLQFLLDLPSKLSKFVENESYSMAVRYYSKAKRALDHYKQMPSFKGIDDDCNKIINNLKSILNRKYDAAESSTDTILECAELLIQLDESPEEICRKYIERSQKLLDKDLEILEANIKLTKNPIENQLGMDILEFIDFSCSHFISNLSLSINTYNEIFLNQTTNSSYTPNDKFRVYATNQLNSMINTYWDKYCFIIRSRFEAEQNSNENTIIVRAVDRFYRRMQTINKQIPNFDLSTEASSIALYAATVRVKYYLEVLKKNFNECLIDIRQSVAVLATNYNNNERKLQSLLDSSHRSLTEQIKNVLTNLQAFIASDISFSAKVHFNEPFCKNHVRESLVVPYLKYIAQIALEFSNGSHDPVPSPLLLILTKLCLEFESVTIGYLLTLVDEQFFINNKTGITKQKELVDLYRDSARSLLNYYVKVKGLNLSQMIRKSVETRDWLNTIEPRNVRAVMKRIVEDVTSMDIQVGELFEEGVRKDKGSDSSRNTFGTRQTHRSAATWSNAPSNIDNKLLNNIQKLFAEKIEIFTPVEFNKVSVLTGIIKITLKTFLECLRLKTFSKYGLQQIQVDCYYLKLYLWRFVSDENLVYILLDEIITSAIQRSNDPVLMESKIVELICDSG